MIQRRAELASFLAVMVLFGIGLHKIDTNTTNRLQANESSQAQTNYHNCLISNQSKHAANARWANEKHAWVIASQARGEAAKLDTDPAQKKIDQHASNVYKSVANSIHPYPYLNCAPLLK